MGNIQTPITILERLPRRLARRIIGLIESQQGELYRLGELPISQPKTLLAQLLIRGRRAFEVPDFGAVLKMTVWTNMGRIPDTRHLEEVVKNGKLRVFETNMAGVYMAEIRGDSEEILVVEIEFNRS